MPSLKLLGGRRGLGLALMLAALLSSVGVAPLPPVGLGTIQAFAQCPPLGCPPPPPPPPPPSPGPSPTPNPGSGELDTQKVLSVVSAVLPLVKGYTPPDPCLPSELCAHNPDPCVSGACVSIPVVLPNGPGGLQSAITGAKIYYTPPPDACQPPDPCLGDLLPGLGNKEGSAIIGDLLLGQEDKLAPHRPGNQQPGKFLIPKGHHVVKLVSDPQHKLAGTDTVNDLYLVIEPSDPCNKPAGCNPLAYVGLRSLWLPPASVRDPVFAAAVFLNLITGILTPPGPIN